MIPKSTFKKYSTTQFMGRQGKLLVLEIDLN